MATDEVRTLLRDIFGTRIQIPLAEVADVTGFSYRSMLDRCRTRPPQLDHVRDAGRYFMTLAQLEAMLDSATRPAGTPARPVKAVTGGAGRAVDVEAWRTRKLATLARKAG